MQRKSIQNLNSLKISFCLIFLLFIYQLYLTYLLYDPTVFFTGDGLTYKELSEKLFNEFKYYENFPEEYPYRSWRTPGYPFFLFLLKYINFDSANQLYVLNQYFLIHTYFLFYKNLNLFNSNNLINFFLILILYFAHINDQFMFYIHNHNEPFYIFLVTLSIYIISSSIIKKNNNIYFGLIILSFSCLVRTPTLPITTLILITLLVLSSLKIIKVEKKILVKYLCIFYIFPLCWMIRNYFVLDTFPFFIGSQAGHILLGTFREIDWVYIDNFAYDKINILKEKFEVIRPKLITAVAIERILDDPIYYLMTRIMNFSKYLINNFAFFSIIFFIFITITKFNIFQNLKIIKKFMKFDLINIILAFGFVFSIIFMAEMSVTFHVPRYGIFPSILIMFYCNILILKILEFKRKES